MAEPSSPSSLPGAGGFVTALAENVLLPGSGRTLHLEGHTIALFNIEGEYFAMDDRCPHRGGPLGAGWVEGTQVFCPLHGWAFDVKTGQGVTNCEKNVRTYATRLSGGFVQINISNPGKTVL